MIYRVKQLVKGLMAKITEADQQFINHYLAEGERNYFFQLRVSEQYHSLQVAYGCLRADPQNTQLIRGALLHDIGKVGTNLSLFNKSLVVLVEKVNVPLYLLPEFVKKGMVYKKNHPERGVQLLTPLGVEAAVLEMILTHHNPEASSKDAALLMKYDNMN